MMRLIRVLAILIIASVFFLIANAPAHILKPYLTNSLNFPFSLNGSIWQGSATSKHFQQVNWHVKPLYLLTGKLSATLSILIDKQNHISADASINLAKTLKLNNIKGVLTSQYLQQFSPETPFLFNATININQAQAQWRGELPPNLPVTSKGSIVGKRVDLLGEQLGSYRLNYNFANKSVEGTITSTPDSAVDTNLNLHISPQSVLTVQGEVLPKSNDLKTIFQELNISFNPNIKTQLPSF